MERGETLMANADPKMAKNRNQAEFQPIKIKIISSKEEAPSENVDYQSDINRFYKITTQPYWWLRRKLFKVKRHVRSILTDIYWGRNGLGNLRAERNELRRLNKQLRSKRDKLSFAYNKLHVALMSTRTKLHLARETINDSLTFFPVYRQGLLAHTVSKTGSSLAADCYVALLPSCLPTAFELQRRYGGEVICDCVENIDVHKHSLAPNWDPVALQMVNMLARGALQRCDKILTIGDALAETLHEFEKPILVLRNFREFEEPIRNNRLRTMCRAGPNDVLLFASGNVVVGFEPIIDALYKLPPQFKLAAFVRLKPAAYREKMLARIAELGLNERILFFPFVAYSELSSNVADADIGLITSDIANPNGAVALPNRCFDYLTGGLPVVAPPMPDVKALIEQYGFGRSLSSVTADEWYKEILAIAGSLEHYRDKAKEARRLLTWESQDDDLYDFLGRPKSVTLIGFRDLSRYQRHLRLSRTLGRFGCKVRFAFFSLEPDIDALKEQADFYYTDTRHQIGDGLRNLRERDGINI